MSAVVLRLLFNSKFQKIESQIKNSIMESNKVQKVCNSAQLKKERSQMSPACFKMYTVVMVLCSFAFLGIFMAGFFLTKRELGLKSTCDVSYTINNDCFLSFQDMLYATYAYYETCVVNKLWGLQTAK